MTNREKRIWGMACWDIRDCNICPGCRNTDIRLERKEVFPDEGDVFALFICNTCGDEMRWST